MSNIIFKSNFFQENELDGTLIKGKGKSKRYY